jgi:hypothetical protein
MSRSMNPHKREVTTALDLTNLTAASYDLEILEFSLLEALLARPFQSISPGLVAEPVANEVCVTLFDDIH